MRVGWLIEYGDGRSFELEFNRDKHTYMVDGNKIPSVTRVIDSCFPKYLTDWAVQEAADYFLSSVEQYKLSPGSVGVYQIPNSIIDHIYKGMPSAHKAISEKAADVGSTVHDWISAGILCKLGKGGMPDMPEDEEAIRCIEAFKSWARDVKPEWLLTEERVYYHDDESDSNIHSFAGTVDAVARIDGQVCVIDFKTSKKIYKPYYLQVVAYQHALKSMKKFYGQQIEGIILRLDKEKGVYQENRFYTANHIDTFFECLNLKRWASKRIPPAKWKFSEELRGPDT